MQRLAPENHRRRFSWSGWKNLLLPQLNRRSLFVYGSEVAVEKECVRQKEEGVFVIHPFSRLRSYYIMCMVAITFLNLIGIPMEIAFLDGNSGVGWEGFNVFSDTLFLIDVGLNFRMGIITEDSEGAILDLKSIRQRYLKSWFVPDMVAAFPVGYILLIADLQYHGDSPSSRASKMMRILMFVRILSLVRLLRVSRLVRFFNEVERVSNANLEVMRLFLRILSLFMMIFLLCHWNGCIQYFVPMLEEFPSDCWVRRENLMNATVGEKYSFGVFRALSHMTAISYDEVELWIVMTSIVSGALMYTVMVANTAAMMTDVDITARAYKNKMNHLEDYMTFMKLPKALRMRINNYFQARYAGKWYDEKDVLKWVSSSLREEILMTMCSSHVRKVPFFRNCDINFINAILLELQYEVFQEGDIIIRQNTPGDRMFFIEHGQPVKPKGHLRMNPSERFFAKLRKLTVYLETESNNLLHASQNPQDEDEDEENGAQALYQLHSEVRALKRQVQDQLATHDSTEMRNFVRRCLVLKQRTTEDIDRLKKHYEKYGYRPRTARQGKTEMSGRKEAEEQAERDSEKLDAAEEDNEIGQGVCEEAQQSETPEKMQPPVDQLRTPKLSDFGLSALQFQRVIGEAEPPHSAAPVPAVALSPPPFVMNMHPPQPKTPKCSLRMEEDAPTPRLEDFGISEYTMCWNNDFTMDLFNKKPPKSNSERTENGQKPSHVFPTLSSVANKNVGNESLESPEPPVFCTPGFKIEKHRIPSSPPLNGKNDLDSPPRPNNCPSTPELPAFETPFISKLIKKDDRQEESDRHKASQEGSLRLPAPSFDAPEMPKVLRYEDEAIPEMPTLQSLFGNSLAFKNTSGDASQRKMGADVLDLKQTPVPMHENGFNQDWCLATPKVRMKFPVEPCTPEMPDISSVTQDILKLVAQCKS
ncbi:potassium sodium hyperpolarization-activated cyclic nucleotide-gated channel 1-like protein [Labeo rohita]|uniref:Potassium sodium hyperpolarization-activated cyclic nucleotide-gated channel 1-like protein n=1 Tax=Labeo rohita TaxID=84645 RepID=A0A498MMA1_LABRO|nr:potassium sodium hyperpolarization-activated cyclic nucleotide-gated channel 1-like protein [Labeo rohita]